MKEKRKSKGVFQRLFDTIKSYVELNVEYFWLTLVEKISLLVGRIFFLVFLGILGLVSFLLIMLLFYNLLMTWIGIDWVVTLIELGFVLLIITILIIFKDKLIIKPVANMIIRVLNTSEEEKEEQR